MHQKLFAVLGFVLLFNLLFYKAGSGIITVLFFITIHLLFLFLQSGESKNKFLAKSSSFIAIALSVLFILTANELLATLLLLLITFSTIFTFFFYNLATPFSFALSNYLTVPLKSLVYLFEGFFRISNIFKNTKLTSLNTTKTTALIKGLFLGIPLTAVLFILLTSADPVFFQHTVNIIDRLHYFFSGPFWERLLVSILLLFTSLGILASFHFMRTEKEEESAKEISSAKQLELVTFLSLPVILFLLFIIIQFEYLFSNLDERSLSAIGINSLTYSEYVRRGFVELLIASSISLAVVAFVSRFVHRIKNTYELTLKSLISVLIIETQILLFSVFWRVLMYQAEHGLTRLRVFGMAILLALALSLILYLTKVWINITQKIVFLSLFLIVITTVSITTFVNVDQLIAQQFKPTINGRVDTYYIATLSFDAASGWKDVILQAEKELEVYNIKKDISANDTYIISCLDQSLASIKESRLYLFEKYNKDPLKNWKNLNFSEYNAFKEILDQKEIYDKLDPLLSQTTKLLKPDNQNPQTYLPKCGAF